MTHIALVVPGLDRIGGAERQVMTLAAGLRGRGWQVSVVALSGSGADAREELARLGIAFAGMEMRKGLADPRGWVRMNRWLREQRPDVVHAHLPHGTWMARWSRLAAPVRVLVDTVHSSGTGGAGRRLGYRFSAWGPDMVTAVSVAAGDAHLAAGMVAREGLVVLPNGVDTNYWRPDEAVRAAMRRQKEIEQEFLWFAAGRLDAVKDYPLLLRAMVDVPAEARLVIAGAGPLLQDLKILSAELGVDGRVTFLGFEQDVRRWMQAADGFVLSSRMEGLPISVLEAGACALAAVATDVAGTREVLRHGETGLLARPRDPVALAACMTELMTASEGERLAMGRRARERVVGCFGLEAVLDRWEALYRMLLKRNAERRYWGR